ncbi:ABC transporter substrate-binding protein [Pollutimonas harenae]|uniref:ABC transporter substrate-binding protein n=1 Tax=Pollutimonas harenae TaxID=657015 RepID=A0A853H0B5_9BURK|nr:ABC transporter substrate-binding protein [Pollutimonas harenae]NYT84013.1 ABC transporter substrate-binding protein [Pollutimonas harenae]TEA73561.1 ABC transporter substrate-binding protein [Pollutimonas harenae]
MNNNSIRGRELLLENGTLRAAINYGNPVLAQRGPAGEPQGVSVVLARVLAQRLGAELEFVPFEAAGKVVEAAAQGIWDVGFLAIDPMRADQVSFTAPYVLIEGTYLVRDQSPYTTTEQMDASGTRIAVGKGAAYDLFLSRSLRHAEIIRAATSAEAVDLFLEQELDAAAGVRQPLEAVARDHAGLKVLPGCFTAIRQAVVTPAKNEAALPFLKAFIEEMKASGLVAKALRDSGQDDGLVAPAE